MSSEWAIRVEQVGKCYHVYDKQADRLKQFIFSKMRSAVGMLPRQYYREYWALRDISFDVGKGETVGIIGCNGSGKSTLLQMICGTLSPTVGKIQVRGRVAALLELGSGFNPEFTGRENVYLNGSVLGLTSSEISARFDSIIEFAGIGNFIDQPVKTYSSGMMVRLAFAVIAHVDADILIIDEALAVGDVFFQQKCMRFLRTFQARQGTVLFVSHDTGAVLSLCDKAVLLAPDAAPMQVGGADQICKRYLESQYADPARRAALAEAIASDYVTEASFLHRHGFSHVGEMTVDTVYTISAFRQNAERFGQGGANIVGAGFLDASDQPVSSLRGDQRASFFIRVLALQRINYPAFGFMIKNSLGEYVYAEGTDMHFRQFNITMAAGDIAVARFEFTMPHLIRGRYLINVAFAEGIGDDHIQHSWLHDAIQLDVIDGRLVHGYSGMNAMRMSIHIDSPKG